jgi:hypothetical protein
MDPIQSEFLLNRLQTELDTYGLMICSWKTGHARYTAGFIYIYHTSTRGSDEVCDYVMEKVQVALHSVLKMDEAPPEGMESRGFALI